MLHPEIYRTHIEKKNWKKYRCDSCGVGHSLFFKVGDVYKQYKEGIHYFEAPEGTVKCPKCSDNSNLTEITEEEVIQRLEGMKDGDEIIIQSIK